MRILFETGEQKKFIESSCEKMKMSLKKLSREISENIKISYSSMKKYRREELLLPVNVANEIKKLSKINWEEFKCKNILNPNWGQIKGGIKGYKTLLKKYSNKIETWRRIGINKSKIWTKNLKNIENPKKDENLAEFIGICLGDGTLTKYFVRISLNFRNEQPFAKYVSELCKTIFGIYPKLRKDNRGDTLYLTVYSIKVCKFLNKICKLPYGSKLKNKAKIPDFILKDLKLSLSCLRGLVDTDGTIYKGGSVYFYSNNKKLLLQVEEIENKIRIFSSVNEFAVKTSSWNNTLLYFRKVGSSNLKNIVKFIKKLEENSSLYVEDTIKYFDEYENLKLPYKLMAR